ncbi:MAG: type II toxin-antitoxin system PemK/MazF family toxin [Bacteroidota bacterium]|nr:type II toxin-antitoxin system PemK/MazF family toxin [Bacteroidota bacterium]
MQTGDIVIVSFPYTDLISFKARPAVVVAQTKDNYDDVIVALISSVVPTTLLSYQMMLQPDGINNLRTTSVIKISRLATVEQNKIITTIGKLTTPQLNTFKILFKSLVE